MQKIVFKIEVKSQTLKLFNGDLSGKSRVSNLFINNITGFGNRSAQAQDPFVYCKN